MQRGFEHPGLWDTLQRAWPLDLGSQAMASSWAPPGLGLTPWCRAK